MAQPGWYPDPDRTPGRYRWFDGNRWTAQTTRDPRSAGSPGAAPIRRRPPWLPIGIAALVLAVVVAAVALWPRGEDDQAGDPEPTSTVSSYDDGRTTPPTASPTPSPSVSATARPVACDEASPDQEPAPPADGRVHGGPLSFGRLPAPWEAPVATSRVPYSRDSEVQVLVLPEKYPWQASVQVGVATFDPYPGGDQATAAMLQCVLTSDFYTGVIVRVAEDTARATSVDGRAATQRDVLLTFRHPLLRTRGSRLRFVVVDSSPRTYFFSAVPMERSDLLGQVDQATRSLTVG
ncbi:hypothetical protein FHX74_002060 [Friedmanniella endophytica]|uniref:DUF2510 domain-containing protein n=1 Tax=Microlunatus kandeliicorticis TaxID=1759536 RepID=A0A7W3ISI0_9ACTN|nr:DUF2510 domain-containing protein [Microlunatus kandeliicorticis]MBA8794441.1 hypothetical protein [Microlunatus kandeliicorticis]